MPGRYSESYASVLSAEQDRKNQIAIKKALESGRINDEAAQYQGSACEKISHGTA